jgi:hypothetical protein
MKSKMGNQHQKNLKVILSMEQLELAGWLADLPDEEIVYVEWLIDEVETALDNMVLENSGLLEAAEVIAEIKSL